MAAMDDTRILPDDLTQLSLPPSPPLSARALAPLTAHDMSGELSLPSLDVNSSSLFHFLGLPPPNATSPTTSAPRPTQADKENAPIFPLPAHRPRVKYDNVPFSPIRKPQHKRTADRILQPRQSSPPSSFSLRSRRSKKAVASTPRSARDRVGSLSSISLRAGSVNARIPAETSFLSTSGRRDSAELSAWAATAEFGEIAAPLQQSTANTRRGGWEKEVTEEMIRLSLSRSGLFGPMPPVSPPPAVSSPLATTSPAGPRSPEMPTEPATVRMAPNTPSRPRWADFLLPSAAPMPPGPNARRMSYATPATARKKQVKRSLSGPAIFSGKPTIRLVSPTPSDPKNKGKAPSRSVSAPLGNVPNMRIFPATPRLTQSAGADAAEVSVARPAPAQRKSWSTFASSSNPATLHPGTHSRSTLSGRSSQDPSRSEVLERPSQDLSFGSYWATAPDMRISTGSASQSGILRPLPTSAEDRIPRRVSIKDVISPRPVVLLEPARPEAAVLANSRPTSRRASTSLSRAGSRLSKAPSRAASTRPGSRMSLGTRPESRLSLSSVREVVGPQPHLDRRSSMLNCAYRLETVEDSRTYAGDLEARVSAGGEEETRAYTARELERRRRLFWLGFAVFPAWWIGALPAWRPRAEAGEKTAEIAQEEWRVWQLRCRGAAVVSLFVIAGILVLVLVFTLH